MKKKVTRTLTVAIMKITILQVCLLFFVLCSYSNNIAGQELLDKKITLKLANVEIRKALTKIELLAGVKFIYSPEIVQASRKITINAHNTRLNQVLIDLFTPVKIRNEVINDQYIVLSKDEEPQITVRYQGNDSFNNAAPQKIITGSITNEKGEPLAGASINVKGSARGTTTNAAGRFELTVEDDDKVLVITFTGYTSKEITIGNQTSFAVLLTATSQVLDEVVAVGYGTARRSDLIGSVSSINNRNIEGKGFLNINQALQGNAPGVMVTGVNGQPGSTPIVRIRGVGTLNDNNPLYIIDGVPITNENGLDIVNPQDIESIEILKDAASASIYGSRSGNGVILITTKKGSRGKTDITYGASLGYNTVSNRLNLLNAKDYAMISDEALVNGGFAPIWNGSTGRADTDWQDAIFQKGMLQSHIVSARGNKENIRYYLSLGYDDQKGTLLQTKFRRYSVKSNVEIDITSRLQVGVNLSYINSKSDEIQQGINSVLINAVRMPATVPVYNPDGTLAGPLSINEADGANPVGFASRSVAYTTTDRVLGNLFAVYKILPGLQFKSSFSGDVLRRTYSAFNPTYNEGLARNEVATLREIYTRNQNINWENTLSYNKAFGNGHTVSAVAGSSVITFYTLYTEAWKSGFLNNDPNMRYFQAGTQQDLVTGGKQDWALMSYFGRVNYDYQRKYLAQINMRTDGSSRFGKNQRWGSFPSFALGWRISEESFMKDISWLSDLKLRGSYGILGNEPSNIYGFTSTMVQTRYAFGSSQVAAIGYAPGPPSNDDYRWETSYMTNLGIDLGFLSNRLLLTVEYYNKQTKDILQVLPLPGISGSAGGLTNIGEMKNSGLELSARYQDNLGELRYTISGNLTTIQNEVIKLYENNAPITNGNSRTIVGETIGRYYGWVVEGIFQNQAEIAAAPTQTGASPGDLRFKDINGDKVINADDRDYLGQPLPKLMYGANFSLEYKGFDFALFLQGVSGNSLYYEGKYYIINGGNKFNKSTDILNRWQKEGDITTIPRVSVTDPNDNFRASGLFVEDGSYMRIKNLQLGYTLNNRWLRPTGIRSARIYVSATNLFTFTNYSGFDPEIEIANALHAGYDQITYPQPKTILFGLNISL